MDALESNKKIIISIAAFVLVVALTAGGLFLLNRKSKGLDETDGETTSSYADNLGGGDYTGGGNNDDLNNIGGGNGNSNGSGSDNRGGNGNNNSNGNVNSNNNGGNNNGNSNSGGGNGVNGGNLGGGNGDNGGNNNNNSGNSGNNNGNNNGGNNNNDDNNGGNNGGNNSDSGNNNGNVNNNGGQKYTKQQLIDAYINGNYYVKGLLKAEGEDDVDLDMALRGADFRTKMDVDDLKLTIIFVDDGFYFLDDSKKTYTIINKSLLQMAGMDVSEMQDLTGELSLSGYKWDKTETGKTRLNGTDADVVKYYAQDITVEFYFTGNDLKLIKYIDQNGNESLSLEIETFSPEAPDSLFSTQDYAETSFLEFFGASADEDDEQAFEEAMGN